MSKKTKDYDSKYCIYYFFDDMIKIKKSWSKYQIKVNEKSYKNILGLCKLNLDSDLPLNAKASQYGNSC